MRLLHIITDMAASQQQLQRLAAKSRAGRFDSEAIAQHRRECIRLGAHLQRLEPANDSRFAAKEPAMTLLFILGAWVLVSVLLTPPLAYVLFSQL